MIVSEMYRNALRSLDEEKKLSNFIEEDGWSVEMLNLIHNLLRSTVLDQKLLKIKEMTAKFFHPYWRPSVPLSRKAGELLQRH